MVDMKRCGHSERFRLTVAEKVVGRYRQKLQLHLSGQKTMYRNKTERQEEIEQAGGQRRKDTWFRGDGYTSTITIPPTPGSKLVNSVRREVENCAAPKGTKTKVIEVGGCRVGSYLGNNSFCKENCDRPRCGLCCKEGEEGGVEENAGDRM